MLEALKGNSRSSRLRTNESGKGPVVALLVLGGLVLLIIGLVFAFEKGVAWPTPTGFILAAVGTFGVVGVVLGGKWAAIIISVVGYLGAAFVLIGHYLHYF